MFRPRAVAVIRRRDTIRSSSLLTPAAVSTTERSRFMVCEHLQKLYQLCLDQKIRLSGSDLIHVVCQQCGRKDVCPSNLRDDHDDETVEAASERTERKVAP